MAETLYLVSRTTGDEAQPVINGVIAVVINKDSGQTNAQIIASAIAKCESPDIAWPALLSSRAWRPRALETAASIASPAGSGTHVSKILARLSTKANKACWARPKRKISRLIWSMLVASRSSAPIIVSSRPVNSWSIAALRKALGLA